MVKTTEQEVTKIDTLYHYYCDECGKHLGDVREFDDGYVPEPDNCCHEYIECRVGTKSFVIDEILCDKCSKELYENLEKVLVKIGFVERK